MVTLPVPPLMSTPMPPGSLVLPIVPPLIVTEPAELVMSMPSPVWPLMLDRADGQRARHAGEADAVAAAAGGDRVERRVERGRVDQQRGAVVRGDLRGADVGDVDGAGALRPQAEGVGAVDRDVDAAVEAVGAGVGAAGAGAEIDAVADRGRADVVDDGDLAAEGRVDRGIADRDAVAGRVVDGGRAGDRRSVPPTPVVEPRSMPRAAPVEVTEFELDVERAALVDVDRRAGAATIDDVGDGQGADRAAAVLDAVRRGVGRADVEAPDSVLFWASSTPSPGAGHLDDRASCRPADRRR